MNLDELQEWMESLHQRIKEQKELVEYKAYLLGKIIQPWSLGIAPKAVQDLHQEQIVRQKQEEVELSRLAGVDTQLRSVEDILQKARTLHKKEVNPVKLKLPPDIEKKPNVNAGKLQKSSTTNGMPDPTKPLKPSKARRPGMMSKRPLSTKLKGSNPTSARSIEDRLKQSVVKENPHNLKRESRPKDLKNEQKDETSATITNMNPKVPDKRYLENKQADLGNVRINFTEVEKHLDLPSKLRRLLAMHSKLKKQASDYWKELECNEETIFILNMTSSRAENSHRSARTLKALSGDEYRCIFVCANAINTLKGQKSGKYIPVFRKTKDYSICKAAQALRLVDNIYSNIQKKCQYLSRFEIVDFGGSIDHEDFLLQLSLDNLSGLLDDLPYPELSMNYDHPKDLQAWMCEKLKHQFLITERDIVQKISDCHLGLIQNLLENEKGELPTSGLVHALQNTYGLLVNCKMQMPAYVIAD